MMHLEQYQALSVREKEEFARINNLLLANTFIIRETFDETEKRLKINRDYAFIERHFELMRDYLKLSGWQLSKDNAYGIIHVENIFGSNRVKLSKNATLLLYTLRLTYEEESEKLSLKKEAITSVGEVVNKMVSMGLLEKKLADIEINTILALLEKYNVIDKLEGKWSDPETRLIIYPAILFVVTNEKISAIYEMLMRQKETGEEEDDYETVEENPAD